mgnify:CR=1 FL=1
MITDKTQIIYNGIVKVARGLEGQIYDNCGGFVREVLGRAGMPVQGRLRDFGIEVPVAERRAGDLIFYYSSLANYLSDKPAHVGILANPDEITHMSSGRITIDSLESIVLDKELPQLRNSLSFVRIRRALQ